MGESCQTQTVAFCDTIAVLVDKWRTADILYLDVVMAFVTVSHSILLRWDVMVQRGAQLDASKEKSHKDWIIWLREGWLMGHGLPGGWEQVGSHSSLSSTTWGGDKVHICHVYRWSQKGVHHSMLSMAEPLCRGTRTSGRWRLMGPLYYSGQSTMQPSPREADPRLQCWWG